MKLALLSLLLLQAQPPKNATLPVSPDSGIITTAPLWNYPSAEWHDSLKDGVYTAALTDPDNHWRCFVSGIVRDNNRYAPRTTSFTVACADQTAIGTVPPVDSKRSTTK